MRFPGFEGDWVRVKLAELLYEARLRNDDLKYSKEDVLSVSGEFGIVNQIEHLGRSYAGVSVHNYHVVETGDIVYTKSPLKENPYGIIKLNKTKPGIVSTLYAVYKVKPTANGEWIHYYFSLNENVNRYLRPLVKKGAKNDMKINNAYVLHDKIYAPNLAEQHKIAEFLCLVEKRIQTQIKIIEKLESLINRLIVSLFNQQYRFKSKKGQNFHDWKTLKLGDILTIGSGRDYKHLNSGTIPVFGSGGLMTSVDSFLYDGETVCIGRKGTIDKPMFFEGKIWTVDTLFYTHSFKGVLPKFVYYLFNSINWWSHNEASGVPSLSKGSIEKITVKIPSIEEQATMVNILATVDKKIMLERKLLENYRRQKEYLLSALFI